MKIIPKNKNSVYTAVFFVLAFAAFSTNSFFANISTDATLVSTLDWIIFKIFGTPFASLYAVSFLSVVPYILFVLFLGVAAYFGVKATRQLEPGDRSRIVPIIFATIALTSLVVIAGSIFIFPFTV